MFGIIVHVLNELHLSISNSTCTYFYNFSIFNPAKLPNQAILAHLGDVFVQQEIENGEFRGKTLEVPEVPQTSLWGSFPSCHWLMALDDGGVVTCP